MSSALFGYKSIVLRAEGRMIAGMGVGKLEGYNPTRLEAKNFDVSSIIIRRVTD